MKNWEGCGSGPVFLRFKNFLVETEENNADLNHGRLSWGKIDFLIIRNIIF
jgi:hypothetical protein